jgi:polysaccharide pyruvyl transferase WcaK-like protein
VFSYHTVDALPSRLESFVSDAEASAKRVVLLNISGMIARRLDLQREYRAVVEHLHARDCVVVFLPHVVRAGDDDLVQARDLFGAAGGRDDILVEDALRPAQVKNLAARAFCTITGRMHLAIMSLSHATPAITLATVGKVEGLYELFGLPELVVQPEAGCDHGIRRSIDTVLADRDRVSDRIRQHLPRVQELSARNFDLVGGRSWVPAGAAE